MTLAFLLDENAPNGFLTFSDTYENLKDQLDQNYEEVKYDLTSLKWDSYLKNNKYKVFKTKNKENE